MKLYVIVMDLAEWAKWSVIILSESMPLCINCVGSNHEEEEYVSANNIKITLLG